MQLSSLGREGQRNITEPEKTLDKDKQNFKTSLLFFFLSFSQPRNANTCRVLIIFHVLKTVFFCLRPRSFVVTLFVDHVSIMYFAP